MLKPGDTLGILGGGQLGRMTALAAAQYGLKTHVFCPEADAPAGQVTPLLTYADYHDRDALARFADAVQAVTLEFENVPVETLAFLEQRVPVHPGPRVLAVTQDRLLEKDFITGCGIATAPYRAVDSLSGLQQAVQELGFPAILKTRRMGYDGKGQVTLQTADDVAVAWEKLGGQPCILEGFVGFESEASIIAARNAAGETALFPLTANRHEHHILRESIAPAPVAPDVAGRATAIAQTLTERLQVVGLLAVELFLLPDGQVVVNELAPRPHNSGHWTMDGCATSQFHQLVRAVAGWPLGATDMTAPRVRMRNLLGEDVLHWQDHLADPAARLHLYGKPEVRPGRKLGHVNFY